ncbi:hypothetical protein F511_05312 [Dorcoceras hygrometricum]|uniref:Uncharacterized protein n=1 Tax=Dorcoceras hygrometricum TaxID=472368 RepID=A0A2Z7CHB7_9LAMI|nr:hypothetical protein F511_05312 [Dorcoceras hygrometricum]
MGSRDVLGALSNYEVWGRKTFREPYKITRFGNRETSRLALPKLISCMDQLSTGELYRPSTMVF